MFDDLFMTKKKDIEQEFIEMILELDSKYRWDACLIEKNMTVKTFLRYIADFINKINDGQILADKIIVELGKVEEPDELDLLAIYEEVIMDYVNARMHP